MVMISRVVLRSGAERQNRLEGRPEYKGLCRLGSVQDENYLLSRERSIDYDVWLTRLLDEPLRLASGDYLMVAAPDIFFSTSSSRGSTSPFPTCYSVCRGTRGWMEA
jgi:hypothetical protein